MPPGHPPIDGAAGAGQPADTGPKLVYEPASDWVAEPATGMRTAQFRLPRAAGDPNDGELAVFQFGAGDGGTIESNIDIWARLFAGADGQPLAADALKRETRTISGLTVHLVDITGRYKLTDESVSANDWRLLGAIVELPQGRVNFRAVGPSATMAAQRDAFRKMLDALKVHE
jgi:hypothetical protein